MKHSRWVVGPVVAAAISLAPVKSFAQLKANTVPDAQVESDVLKALAKSSQLADQAITSNTVYGTVTLSGSVRDEDSRKLAESIVSRTRGVQKVVDELTLGDSSVAATNPAGASDGTGSTPLLQSDGTLAGPEQQANAGQLPATPQQSPYPQQPPDLQDRPYAQPPANAQQPPYSQQPSDQQQPSPQPSVAAQQPPYPQQPLDQVQRPYAQPPATVQQPGYDPGYGPPQGQAQSQGQSPSWQPPYGTPPRRTYSQPPYGPPPGYAPPSSRPQAYGVQPGGLPVTVPSGSVLRIRINQGLDSRHTQPGTAFDAVVLNDVVADGVVAIPRGAAVQGTVLDSQRAGALKGRGELALQLTRVTLAGRSYPIASDVWSNYGGDKTAHTVNSALGLGVVGAIVGGVAGGGAGAAIGAGVGGAAGLGASAASGGGQAYVPSEAILTFHLVQPAGLTTVSQAEMDRLGYGVPVGAQMRRRYVQPAPYGYPAPYPRYPYPYPY